MLWIRQGKEAEEEDTMWINLKNKQKTLLKREREYNYEESLCPEKILSTLATTHEPLPVHNNCTELV